MNDNVIKQYKHFKEQQEEIKNCLASKNVIYHYTKMETALKYIGSVKYLSLFPQTDLKLC